MPSSGTPRHNQPLQRSAVLPLSLLTLVILIAGCPGPNTPAPSANEVIPPASIAAAPGFGHGNLRPASPHGGQPPSTPHSGSEQAKPDTPAASATPDKPAASATPDKPAASATPDKPAASATPDTPAASATPDTPAASATPDKPAASATPDTPAASATPDTPAASATPDNQEAPKPDEALDKLARAGKRVWSRYQCYTCHRVNGRGGSNGPDLTGVGTKYTSIKGSPDKARAWFHLHLADPQQYPGTDHQNYFVKMPKFPFSEQERNELVEYLMKLQ